MSGTIVIDFDGTLHPYSAGWTGPVPEDEPPTPGALAFCKRAVLVGYRLVVVSTRCREPEGLKGIQDWLERVGLAEFISEVTCEKVPAVAYVDDRAVVYRGSWDDILTDVNSLAERKKRS